MGFLVLGKFNLRVGNFIAGLAVLACKKKLYGRQPRRPSLKVY